MSIGTGLGIAALILAIIGAFAPGVGLFIGWGALAIACVAPLCGDKGLTIATVIISGFAFLFLTPTLWLEQLAHNTGYGEATGTSPMLAIVSITLLILPIFAIGLYTTGTFALMRTSDANLPHQTS